MQQRAQIKLETDEEFLERMRGVKQTVRVRWIGTVPAIDSESALANPDIAIYDHQVTESGRIELLPYFLEQAVSITAHRFGTPVEFASDILK